MNFCKKHKIYCPYCIKGSEIKCIGDEGECKEYVENPVKFPDRYSTELPVPLKSWSEFYLRLLATLPQLNEGNIAFITMTLNGEVKYFNWLYIAMRALAEAAANNIALELYEKIIEVKKQIKELIKYARNEKYEKIENDEG